MTQYSNFRDEAWGKDTADLNVHENCPQFLDLVFQVHFNHLGYFMQCLVLFLIRQELKSLRNVKICKNITKVRTK